MSELDDALAAYHKACVLIRDLTIELGEVDADITRTRASVVQQALSEGQSVTAAREHGDAAVAERTGERHELKAAIDGHLITLRWLDHLLNYLYSVHAVTQVTSIDQVQ